MTLLDVSLLADLVHESHANCKSDHRGLSGLDKNIPRSAKTKYEHSNCWKGRLWRNLNQPTCAKSSSRLRESVEKALKTKSVTKVLKEVKFLLADGNSNSLGVQRTTERKENKLKRSEEVLSQKGVSMFKSSIKTAFHYFCDTFVSTINMMAEIRTESSDEVEDYCRTSSVNLRLCMDKSQDDIPTLKVPSLSGRVFQCLSLMNSKRRTLVKRSSAQLMLSRMTVPKRRAASEGAPETVIQSR
mmetsp:Transcript_1638/g.1978  ORF Transcript_1638/g.1978 Transcript_1638/m.1978 type:complete len:243 (+) Transcript_1638:234-962(+)